MKALITKSLLAILSFSIVLVACQKDEVIEASKLENGQGIAQMYGGELFNTAVKVSKVGSNEVTLSFATQTLAKKMTLQVKENNIDLSTLNSGNYEILYLKHIAVLNNTENGRKYLLTVSNEQSLYLTKKLPESYLKEINVLNGYGLAVATSPLENENAKIRVVDDCVAAGGPGATSCSNKCCSVSCSSAYYATCGKECKCN